MIPLSKDILWDKEHERWLQALTDAFKELHKQYATDEMVVAKVLLTHGLNKLHQLLPNLFIQENGRSKWERFASSGRVLCKDIEHSILFNVVLPLVKLGGAKNSVIEWANQAAEQMLEIHYIFNQVEKYRTNFISSTKIDNRYDMCSLYASYKTWETEQQFEEFQAKLKNLSLKPFDVYIEGPIQLFLRLSSSNFFLLIRSITARNLSDILKSKSVEEKDMVFLLDFVYNIIKESQTLKYFVLLLRSTMNKVFDSWIEDTKNKRDLIKTTSARKRFVINFEQGVIN